MTTDCDDPAQHDHFQYHPRKYFKPKRKEKAVLTILLRKSCLQSFPKTSHYERPYSKKSTNRKPRVETNANPRSGFGVGFSKTTLPSGFSFSLGPRE